MNKFVHDLNLTRYLDLLEAETDPEKRRTLQALLIEEEDRFGSWRERRQQTELLVARGAARVRSQEAVVERLERDGVDAAMARQVLENMHSTLQLFISYRRTLNGSGAVDLR